MQNSVIQPASFRVISDDPDCYKLVFSIPSRKDNRDALHVMSEALHLRLSNLLQRNTGDVLGATNKIDLFEPFEDDSGYIEIDTLHVSEHSISLEAYLYNLNSRLKGKASCSLYFGACTAPAP